ncbi:TIGR04141 family sporadically distributed protein [Aeromonas veronii]|uniref:TIGR04141 family sporadically distributed protein n=1 Tax=Aeromonas veronii TaxID=654 RepID=UPI001F20DE84|nr:TIGR04141 family sporadically distributed protein [Aeromonas veronii]MCF5891038.1 TIGR04141 family sporadically distributed protein [Aeromonas veronii]
MHNKKETNDGKYQLFNFFLVNDVYKSLPYDKLLKADVTCEVYTLKPSNNISGSFFIKKPTPNVPIWVDFAQSLVDKSINTLQNQLNSAVLIIKGNKATIAMTFGHGRHLLDMSYFVSDFGIKTALNTLDHDSLRGVDIVTLDEQGVHKKTQASRATGVEVFGIDIYKDLIRGVTGSPKFGVELSNISGSGTTFSFGKKIKITEIPSLVDTVYKYYNSTDYKKSFSWVDNIRRLEEKKDTDPLNIALVDELKKTNPDIIISIPEMLDWDKTTGFSFTRNKSKIKPTIEYKDYLEKLDRTNLSVDTLKKDRLFVFNDTEDEGELHFKLYDCLYFEVKKLGKTYILFSGAWYEIADNFVQEIDNTLDEINISSLDFPEVFTWKEICTKGKNKGKTVERIEEEGNYNTRTSKEKKYYLLDKKLIKSSKSTTSIELCDLLTDNRQFIHVKHKKGGSAGLSHLFAQGNVSAEIMLGDKQFRIAARRELAKISKKIEDLVPLNKVDSRKIEIVFLILGDDSKVMKKNLPFFSKVNLAKTYENLSQKGFTVTIAGAGKKEKKP